MRQLEYEYKNLPIPGGGYVTGFLFSKIEKDVFYIRTDIGGSYRLDADTQRWESLSEHVTMEDLSETYPIALAIDDKCPGSLYIACGMNYPESGVIAISKDYGKTFCYERIPVRIHGNMNGRGTGERLYVDGNEMWFASQQEGLWYSDNLGKDWKKCRALPEDYLTLVAKIGDLLVVGTAGVTTATENIQENAVSNKDDKAENVTSSVEPGRMRGHSLYVSCDNGVSFAKLETPKSHVVDGCKINGLVAQRCVCDDTYLYVTFAATGRNSYVIENGYSCDSGDSIDGHVARYPLDQLCKKVKETMAQKTSETGVVRGVMEDITPGFSSKVTGVGLENSKFGDMLEYGISGIDVSAMTRGMLICSSIVKYDGDSIFLSLDYGQTWKQILYDLAEGKMEFRAPYMRPECNGGHSLIHWLSDVKINPFNDNEAWFNSGTGVFRTENLKAEECVFTDWCDGIEETVHLNVYSMPSGPVQVIDIVGDLGGFAFEELDKPCGNSFADADGNRYITCINADFSDANPNLLVVTPRGNWTGKTFGGLILSQDQGRTFERLPMPYGLTKELDEALQLIECPNVNSGWVAMSPNGENIVWSVANMISLPVSRLIVSHDGGRTFTCCQLYKQNGQLKTEGKVKVFSDRMNSKVFYGFGETSDFYISRDGGQTYKEYVLPEEFPKVEFGLIDCANKTEVRGECGKSGVFYIAIGKDGLWKLTYRVAEDEAWEPQKAGQVLKLERLTAPDITVYRMGLGVGKKGGDYYKEPKAIYFNGIVEGKYGFYRTLDEGESFECLNTDRQMFGEINSIDGDCRTFGRFYLATGSNGLKYGNPIG